MGRIDLSMRSVGNVAATRFTPFDKTGERGSYALRRFRQRGLLSWAGTILFVPVVQLVCPERSRSVQPLCSVQVVKIGKRDEQRIKAKGSWRKDKRRDRGGIFFAFD